MMGQFFNNPDTMQKLGMGLDIFGTLSGAKGQLDEGNSMASYYNFMAGQYKEQSKEILKRSIEDQKKLMGEGKQTISTQRAIMAANGVYGDSGTPGDIISDTQRKIELDKIVIGHNADLASRQALTEAQLARFSGKTAKSKAKMGAFNTILGGATRVADTWMRWKQTGAGKKKVDNSGWNNYTSLPSGYDD